MWSKKNSFFLFLLLISSLNLWSQSDLDRNLANNYYNEGQFEKAILYFEKIYKEDHSNEVFEPYYKSLVALKEFKEAEKLCKKQIKEFPKDLTLIVYTGLIYEAESDVDRANSVYTDAINEIGKETKHPEISRLATLFERENKLEFAIQTYQRANQFASSKSMYNRNVALIYGRQGKTEKMVESLLDVIDEDERYLVSVQSSLSSGIDFNGDPVKLEILKSAIIKRSQADPSRLIYNELLAWVYMLSENYAGAFIQLKSIDKKEGNEGQRIMELGRMCVNNERYDEALKCFDYVIELGPYKAFYKEAKISRISTLRKKVIESGSYTHEELLVLKKAYEDDLEYMGKSSYTIELVRELAHLEGYYLNNPKKGIELLELALSTPGITNLTKGEIKIELGDMMVIDDRIWDASLLFMQVEKEFKEDKIGHLAKFKAAQVFYFAGDFEFAQGQLDVLKSSTSKLISNDAMELSLLITDNYNMDTTQETMRMFASSELLIKQHRYPEANATFDSITTKYLYHSLNDEILLRKSEMALAQQNTDAAIAYLEELIKTYPTDILADNALYSLAKIYDKILNDKDKAASYYKRIIFDYKGSLFGVDARKRYREIAPSDKFNNEESPFIVQPHIEN